MQDIYRWTIFAQSLGNNSQIFESELQAVGETIQSLEHEVELLKNKVSGLENNTLITDLDIEAQNCHLHLLAQILYRKRKAIVLHAVCLCITQIKRLRYEVDLGKIKNAKRLCKEILEQILIEYDLPKSFQLGASFSKLKRTIAKTLGFFNKSSPAHLRSKVLEEEIVTHA
ncbi:unnamed protein product [Blepharisma stoltei]|uniref:Uncharacterized protein n=1 Tax=Blepharisma stoltei TaxID=1481888 RepID=A0AAU9IUT7_9CILI|nr:unnamed protein product [Blepharisma stoltei]